MIHNFFSTPIYIDNVFDNAVESELSLVMPKLKFKNDWQPDNDTALTTFIPDEEINVLENFTLDTTKD
jgi:hypothetical protein